MNQYGCTDAEMNINHLKDFMDFHLTVYSSELSAMAEKNIAIFTMNSFFCWRAYIAIVLSGRFSQTNKLVNEDNQLK
jgi:hypothetical protein